MGRKSLYESIGKEYLPLYRKEGIPIKDSELRHLISKSSTEAERYYHRLEGLKICSRETYIRLWVRKVIDRDFATKSVRPFPLNNPPPLLKASAKYFSLFPYESHKILRNKLFQAKPKERKDVWLSFNLPMEQIQRRFKKMTQERIKMALAKGYSSYIGSFLGKSKIPQSNFAKFVKNADKVIAYCNRQLNQHFVYDNLPVWFYSEFNEPCFVCRMPFFPFKKLEDVWAYVASKHNLLDKLKSKIDIGEGDASKMSYKNESDSFEIVVEKTANIRHQALDLLHELSHVIDYLQQVNNGLDPLERGIYFREKEASRIEIELLSRVSPLLLQSIYNRVLLLLRTTLFEISLYKNPNQDLHKLYAKTFNRCFRQAKQNSNWLYVLDENVALKPLSSLPYAVAYSESIEDGRLSTSEAH